MNDFLGQLTGQIVESLFYSAQRKVDQLRLGKEEAERLRKQKYEKRKKDNKVEALWFTIIITIAMGVAMGVFTYGLGFIFAILVSPVFYGIIRVGQSNPYK
jgi:Trk-type K+ transport system membrane component